MTGEEPVVRTDLLLGAQVAAAPRTAGEIEVGDGAPEAQLAIGNVRRADVRLGALEAGAEAGVGIAAGERGDLIFGEAGGKAAGYWGCEARIGAWYGGGGVP